MTARNVVVETQYDWRSLFGAPILVPSRMSMKRYVEEEGDEQAGPVDDETFLPRGRSNGALDASTEDTMGSQHKGLESDLQSLRQDVGKLAETLASVIGDKGGEISGDLRESVTRVRDTIGETMSQAGQKGQEMIKATQLDGVRESVEEQMREHPWAVLAIAASVGAAVGAQLRRSQ